MLNEVMIGQRARLTPSAQAALTSTQVVARAAGGLLLGCALLIGLAKLAGLVIPVGELMPVSVSRLIDRPDIVMVDLHRSLAYPLTRDNAWDADPEISPDGKQVAYISYDDGAGKIFISDLSTGRQRQITDGTGLYSLPAWSPDGSQIAFSATQLESTEIYVMDVDTGVLRQLTVGFGIDTHPAWSPDGRHLAFIFGDGFDLASLAVMPLDCPEVDGVCGMVAQQMTDQPGYDWSPTWSPDGKQIAFASDRGGGADVYVMDTDCVDVDIQTVCVPNVRPMTREHFPNGIQHVSWSRDGSQVRFVTSAADGVTIYALNAGCDITPEGCRLQRLAAVY